MTQQNGRAVIAVAAPDNHHFNVVRRKLLRHFNEVSIPEMHVRSIFNILAEEQSLTVFFEAKNEYPLNSVLPRLTASLGGDWSQNPFDDDIVFVLNGPIPAPKLVPMNEVVAIYCAMFCLGSLVRYRPELLEAMLSKKDAWLIERFTKSAPTTFMRHISNLISGRYVALANR